ncbi:hypothetical protein [Aquibacillus sediminis]|uniref:hypothetical protein n=1 Tax=Aquibacillus sediminis TaxID=2574734 RepID=UPI001109CAE2|nr:hypothetical protein [Aquibacillus sediminis]
MALTTVKDEQVNLITSKKEKYLPLAKLIYKNLPLRDRLKGKINVEYIEKGITEETCYYHPFWTAQLLVIASRKPFASKVSPQMVFVEGMTGYRGILTDVPYTKTETVEKELLLAPHISTINEVKKYVQDVQQNQINSMYMMKKPTYKLKKLELNYLPFWKVKVETPIVKSEMLLNVNTKENEQYLLKRWKRGREKQG